MEQEISDTSLPLFDFDSFSTNICAFVPKHCSLLTRGNISLHTERNDCGQHVLVDKCGYISYIASL